MPPIPISTMAPSSPTRRACSSRTRPGAATRLCRATRGPSMCWVARLPALDQVQHWKLPAAGAHGLAIDQAAGRLYAACDGGVLVALDAADGAVCATWPLAGVPDATFF